MTIKSISHLETRIKVLSRFESSLPLKPYYTDNPSKGIKFGERKKAIKHRYIQPNFGTQSYLCFDLDYNGMCWLDFDLPRPTITTISRGSGRCHYLYELDPPVLKWTRASRKPQEFSKAIEIEYRDRLRADAGYTGHLTKNPLNAHWLTECHDERYTLNDLSEGVDLPEQTTNQAKQTIETEYSQLGRNCYLFEHGRFFAYRVVSQHKSMESLRHTILVEITNENKRRFSAEPLPERETEQIADSIAKWTWKHQDGIGNRKRRKTRDRGDLRARQVRNAKATHQKRKDKTRRRIHQAIADIRASGKKVTAAEIHKRTRIARTTIDKSGILDKEKD